ncbi:MAG: DUF2935 domain-containing protein [Bacillota bacterium]
MTHPGSSVIQAVREGWFWAGVLRDHATFIHDSLAPHERRAAEVSHGFQHRFAILQEEAQALAQSMGITAPAGSYALQGIQRVETLDRFQGPELAQYQQATHALAQRITDHLRSLKQFKEDLIGQKLACSIRLNLTPTLLQHMVNETEEAYRALTGIREAANLPPPLQALHHHLLWLPDASGHAAALHSGLDPTEKRLLDATDQFKRIFDGMEIKALELYTMLRVAPRMVAVLRRLNRDAMTEIAIFREFLAEMREHLEGCEIMGNLTPLFADHMLREELYYTEQVMLLEQQE